MNEPRRLGAEKALKHWEENKEMNKIKLLYHLIFTMHTHASEVFDSLQLYEL